MKDHLDGSNYKWFDKKYESGEKPTLEDRAHLLGNLEIKISESQLGKVRDRLNDSLHKLGQKGDCSPGLTTIAYNLIFLLASSADVPKKEVDNYISWYRRVIEKRCPHLHQNFT